MQFTDFESLRIKLFFQHVMQFNVNGNVEEFETISCTCIHGISLVLFISNNDYVKTFKNFAWADQRANVHFIFHKVQLRCEECFIK